MYKMINTKNNINVKNDLDITWEGSFKTSLVLPVDAKILIKAKTWLTVGVSTAAVTVEFTLPLTKNNAILLNYTIFLQVN